MQSLSVPIPYEFSMLALPSLAVSLGVIALGIYALTREQASSESVVFFILTWSISLWLFAFAWMYHAKDPATALWWAKAGYIGVICIPAAVFQFSALLMRDYERVRKRVFAVWMISMFFVVLTLTTAIPFSSLYSYSWGFYPKLGMASLPLLGYFFAVMLFALHQSISVYRKSHRNTAQIVRARILLSTFSLAYLAALDFVPAFGINWHPFGYIPIFLFVVIAARSITRYRFKTITPAFAAGEITRAMNDGLIVLDPDGVVRLVNQAACGLFNCREQDLVGRRPMSGMTSSPPFAETLEAVVRSGTVHNYEVNNALGDGSRRSLSLSTSIMRNSAGEALATVCMVNDITDRKRTEEDREKLIAQLQEANRKLQVLDRMKSDFISVVSHDLRTPLTTIKAFAELIMMRPDMSLEQRSKFVNTINLECDRLKRLITDLLDLARIESGSMSWRVEQVCLKAAVLESITSMGLLFENKGINLTTEFPPSLPAVAADRDRIVQVVTNLLTNAAKFTPPGGVIHVSVSSESAHAEQVAVRISDTGVGIPAEDLELIFEKFRRSGGELTDATSGAGLGLAIARQIIENHGGRIWAESEQGKGSTFTFTLPLTRKEPPVVPSP